MPYSYITFHVPFTSKPRIPYHIEDCRTILSTSLSYHPDKRLRNYRILAITIYNDADKFTLGNSLGILREITIFLNITLCNEWSISYLLNTPFADFENEIKSADAIEVILQSLQVEVGKLEFPDHYSDLDRYKNASFEFHVDPINVKEDIKKYFTITLSSEIELRRLKDQILVFVLGANSNKLLSPMYDNVNLKYSMLISVFEDLFLKDIVIYSIKTQKRVKGFKEMLREFIETLTPDPVKRNLYFKTFKDIYLHRNLFTHALKRETKFEQVTTMKKIVSKLGYSLSDFVEGKMGRLGGEEMFIDLIRKSLIEKLQAIQIEN